MVDKKYLKIGVAGLAITALVIGLSVGLTQKNKNINSAASSNAAYETYDIIDTANMCYGKSGKSGGGSAKSGKSESGGYSMPYNYNGKSGKSSNRVLNVPGILEAYGDDTDASTGKDRKLRHQLFGKLLLLLFSFVCDELFASHLLSTISSLTHCNPSSPLCLNRFIQILCVNTGRELYGSAKSGKSSGGYGYGSAKSGKSGSGSSSCYYEDVCKGSSGKSGKSGGSGGSSGKSGKSGSCSPSLTSIVTSNTRVPIPDAIRRGSGTRPGVAEVPLTVEVVSDECTIEKVDITVGIDHSRIGDLELTLSSPGGEKTAILINRQGGRADLVSSNPITFDDASSTDPSTIGNTNPIQAGTFFSQGDGSGNQKLSSFVGGSPPGDWIFTAKDFELRNTGFIESVELRITSNCPCESVSCLNLTMFLYSASSPVCSLIFMFIQSSYSLSSTAKFSRFCQEW